MPSKNERKHRQALARAAMDARDSASRPGFQTIVGQDSWASVLQELNHQVVAGLSSAEDKIRKWHTVYPAAVAILDAGTMLRDPAPAEALVRFEERFGISLPPSYRGFLEVSNGLMLPSDGQFVRLEYVSWYRDVDPMGAELMEEFAEDFDDGFNEPADSEYFAYDKPQCAELIRPRNARTSLALNGPAGDHSHVGKILGWALLVPDVQFVEGEYEVWQQAFEWQKRFASFASYFSEARRIIVEGLPV